MLRGHFIRCAMCDHVEEYSDRPTGSWWTLNFEGPSPAPSVEIKRESVEPPFYFCSADCLKRFVGSDKFREGQKR